MVCNKKEYYIIQADGSKHNLGRRVCLHVNNMNVIEIKVPKGITELCCCNNQLTELTIPEGTLQVACIRNNIKEITLPKSLHNITLDSDTVITNLHELPHVDISFFGREIFDDRYFSMPLFFPTNDDLWRPEKELLAIEEKCKMDKLINKALEEARERKMQRLANV